MATLGIVDVMFNPAAISVAIAEAATSYKDSCGDALPLILSFVMIPLAFQSTTRSNLPKRRDASLLRWREENHQLVAGFPRRARTLVPFVKRSIIWGAAHRVITLNATTIERGDAAPVWPRSRRTPNSEFGEILRSTRFLGLWFSSGIDIATLMSLLGLAP